MRQLRKNEKKVYSNMRKHTWLLPMPLYIWILLWYILWTLFR